MVTEFVMPKLGHLMEEGKIARWNKGAGDAIKKGDAFLLVETEKTTVEVDSPFTGVLTNILVEAGQTVPVGTPLAIIQIADNGN